MRVNNVNDTVKNKELEITSMLTLSTSHLYPNTADILEKGEKIPGVVIYRKDDYGWFLYLSNVELGNLTDMPDDLSNIILFAFKHKCSWLCLDRDGDTTDKLEQYEW